MKNSRIRRVLKGVKKFDLFEKPVQLHIKKDEGHRTVFGAMLTICLLSTMTVLLISELQTLNNRSSPTSYFTEVYHPDPDYYKLDPKNFTIGFSLQLPNFQTYIDPSIYTVTAKLEKKETLFQDGEYQDIYTDYPIDLIPCSVEAIKQEELSHYFQHNLDLPTNFCLDWTKLKNLNLQGVWDSKVFTSIAIYFNICTEETRDINGPPCKSKEEIKQTLAANYLSVAFSTYSLDLTSPYKPFEAIGQDFYTTTSSQIRKEITFYMTPVMISTDYGLITQDVEQLKTIRYNRNTELLDLTESTNFLKLAFRLENTEQVYNRSYTKLQQILSAMGGLWQVLFSLAMIIQKPVSELSYKVQILNSLFNFEGQYEKQIQRLSTMGMGLNTILQTPRIQTIVSSPRNLIVSQKKVQSQSEIIYSSPKIQTQAKQQLRSIVEKNQELLDLQDDDLDQKSKKRKLSKQISKSIKNYFQLVQRKLKLNCCEFVYFLRCLIKKDENKVHQIDFASQKMEKSMDILYLIKKLQEIDKLKTILLSKDQIKVFDYLPKPTIQLNPTNSNINAQYFSILRPVKTDYQSAIEARGAFKEILKDPHNPINKSLISCIDQNVMELLQLDIGDNDFIEDDSISELGPDEQGIPSNGVQVSQRQISNQIV